MLLLQQWRLPLLSVLSAPLANISSQSACGVDTYGAPAHAHCFCTLTSRHRRLRAQLSVQDDPRTDIQRVARFTGTPPPPSQYVVSLELRASYLGLLRLHGRAPWNDFLRCYAPSYIHTLFFTMGGRTRVTEVRTDYNIDEWTFI